MVELAVAAKSREKAGVPPFYRPIRDECLLFEKAFALKLPLLLKGADGVRKNALRLSYGGAARPSAAHRSLP